MVLEALGGLCEKIGRGGVVLTLKHGYQVYALSIAWPLEMHGSGCRGYM
jgi:hypothetical protein